MTTVTRVRTFVGSVKNGQIQLSEPVSLAENSRVYVVIPEAAAFDAATIRSPRLVQPSPVADFAKEIVEVTDASA
jgi:hypothetical protein